MSVPQNIFQLLASVCITGFAFVVVSHTYLILFPAHVGLRSAYLAKPLLHRLCLLTFQSRSTYISKHLRIVLVAIGQFSPIVLFSYLPLSSKLIIGLAVLSLSLRINIFLSISTFNFR